MTEPIMIGPTDKQRSYLGYLAREVGFVDSAECARELLQADIGSLTRREMSTLIELVKEAGERGQGKLGI